MEEIHRAAADTAIQSLWVAMESGLAEGTGTVDRIPMAEEICPGNHESAVSYIQYKKAAC